MDNQSPDVPPNVMNIELQFVDVPNTNVTDSNVSTLQQNVVSYSNPSATSAETLVSLEHLLSAVQQRVNQSDLGSHNQTEPQVAEAPPQQNSQAPDSTIDSDDEDVPEKLRKKYVCDKCGKVYRSKSAINEHVECVHEGTRHMCHLCGITVKWKSNLGVHMRQVHKVDGGLKRKVVKDRKCKQCDKTFRTNLLLYHHLKRAHNIDKPIQCKGCSGSFNPGQLWHDHKKLHPEHYPCYTCKVCQKKFFLLVYFQKHLLKSGHRHHQVEEDPEDAAGKQHDIASDMDSVETLQTNATVTHDKDQSDVCKNNKMAIPDVSSVTAQSEEKSIEITTSDLSCPKCGKVFKGYTSYQRHVSSNSCSSRKSRWHPKCRAESKSGKRVLLCCEKLYDTYHEYQKHIAMHYVRTDKCNWGCKRKFECPVCKKLVGTSSLLYHAQKHSGIKRLACDQCDYRCILETDLEKHMIIHTNSLQYQCNFCVLKFRCRSSLMTHENGHLGVKLECMKCRRPFYDKSKRNSHQRKCLGKATYTFDSEIHRSPGSLGYLCNRCYGVFFVKHRFEVHQEEGCREDAIRRASQTTVINITGESGKTKEIPVESLLICEVCSQMFENVSYYETHVMKCARKGERCLQSKKMDRKQRILNENTEDESVTPDVGFDDSLSDDIDHCEQFPGSEGNIDTSPSLSNSKIRAAKEKLAGSQITNSTLPMQRETDTCTGISSSVKCCTCNKTTKEIISEECTFHQVFGQSKESVTGHEMATEHSEEDVEMESAPKELHCNKCGKTTEKLLLEHRCTPHFFCRTCRKVFTSKKVIEEHSKKCRCRMNNKIFMCSYCNQRFPLLSSLQFHNQHAHHAVVYEIRRTGSREQSEKLMSQSTHLEGEVSWEQGGENGESSSSGKEVCKVQSLSSPPQETTSNIRGSFPAQRKSCHIITLKHVPNRPSNIRQQNVPMMQSGDKHGKTGDVINVHEGYNWNRTASTRGISAKSDVSSARQRVPEVMHSETTAEKRFGSEDNLQNTGRATPGKVLQRPPIIVFQCPVCKQHFASELDLRKHLRKTHAQSSQEDIMRGSSSTAAYQCSFCNQKFSVESNLRIHLRSHSTIMTHLCKYCYMCYRKHEELTSHMKQKHKEILQLILSAKMGSPP